MSSAFYLEARKSLGQNFLRDESALRQIVVAIEQLLPRNDAFCEVVHEIGPGSGALTLPLLQQGLRVCAIEKDARAVQGLRKTLLPCFSSSFSVLQEDILKWSPAGQNACFLPTETDAHAGQKPWRVCVGNLPYYISSDILLWFYAHRHFYRHGLFMLQNEVVDRLQALPSTKDYGRLTVRMQLFFTVKKLFVVPAECFVPKPRVDSAIVVLTPNDFSFSSQQEDNRFSQFTATLFSARRKMLRRTLTPFLQELQAQNPSCVHDIWQTLGSRYGFTGETRPDALCPEAILALHNFFCHG